MSLNKLTENLNNVSSLPDKPTLTASELKAVFDKAVNDIKNYINNILTVEIEQLVNNSKTTVEDNLTSTSTTNALSAKKGKDLKGLIDNLESTKQAKITSGTSAPTGGNDGDIYIQYF